MKRDEWETVRLGDVGEIITGKTPKTSEPENYSSQDICFYKPSDFSDESISVFGESEFYLSNYARPNLKILPPNSVLVTCIGIIGKVGITKHESTCNQQINAIIPNHNLIDSKYLAYAIHKIKHTLRDIANSPVVPIINKSQFSNVTIPLPPLDIQRQIADTLDKVTELIDLRKKQLEKLDELVKARFVELFGDVKTNKFGWEKCRFGDVATKITDGEHGTVPRVEKGEGYLYFMARNITKDGNIDLTETSYVPEEVHRKIYKRCNPETGDILLVCVGATIGKCTIVPKDFEEFSMARSVALIKPDSQKVNSTFLISLLKSDAIQNDISNCAHAAAQAGLYTNMIISLDAFLPPIELQNLFAAFVKQTDKSKSIIQQSLDTLETLKKSLMQEYFG